MLTHFRSTLLLALAVILAAPASAGPAAGQRGEPSADPLRLLLLSGTARQAVAVGGPVRLGLEALGPAVAALGSS